jgi:hypothetical protein
MYKRKKKSEHENKSTRSVKIMIGFEITAVYVYLSLYALERPH